VSTKSVAKTREALIEADKLRRSGSRSTYETGAWPVWQRAAVAYHLALVPDDAEWRADPDQPALRSVEEIRDRAAKLDEASRAVRAYPLRETDFNEYVEQSAAAGWFHEMFRAMYPSAFWRCVEAVRAGDRSGLEAVVRFLEADPWCFRSGYVKTDLITIVVRLQLDETEKARLRRVVLRFVDDPRPRRELRSYAKLARAVTDAALDENLTTRLLVADPVIRFNAQAVLDGLAGNQPARHSRMASTRFKRPS
jgi:hypothetical protein